MSTDNPRFADLGLPETLLRALDEVGYESPSPIQAETIPPLLSGRDVLGQAQTGTGKTAAFALPILASLDLSRAVPQALVLTPTRELAIQVAEACQKYGKYLPGFHVLPIYGGQSYTPQLRNLQRGAHVVVGTPGRILDHLDRGTLDLGALQTLVLDEADEMLRMGFVDDVEAVLKVCPAQRRIALFSATMPRPIQRIAEQYLRDPVRVAISAKTQTVSAIRQRYWRVVGMDKLDALTRLLEIENFDAMIVFTRTKQATEELAEKLAARGFAAQAINGDIVQALRERTISRLKDGQLDILVATDVAARGLDVDRISHVINYDIPVDTESYVHRIGRTGRAGRSGEAILFVTPREQHLLRAIERATRQPIEPMKLPSAAEINNVRLQKFKQRILDGLELPDLATYQHIVSEIEGSSDIPMNMIAAALARLLQGDEPLLLQPEPEPRDERREERREERRPSSREPAPREARRPNPGGGGSARGGLVRYQLGVGHEHAVRPAQIVGALANELGLDREHIGRIEIRDRWCLVELPADLDDMQLHQLQQIRVAGQRLRARRWQERPPTDGDRYPAQRGEEERRPRRTEERAPSPWRRQDR
ncbi:MAG: DEAD/DEAH box helicase [Xanthomonadales bacterium]|nr:DEAD/DEAH box helicase [Xanthomonadales bacterium]